MFEQNDSGRPLFQWAARTRRRYNARHRASEINPDQPSRRFRNRHLYLVIALAAITGLGLTWLATATTDDRSANPAAVTLDRPADRAEAAGRADRSDRTTPDHTALSDVPTVTPSSTAQASPSPATPSPSATSSTKAVQPPAAKSSPATAKSATSTATTTAKATAKATADWVNPLPGASVTSCFGQRWGVLHAGIDLAQPANTPVRAAGAGTVVTAGWAYSGYGISVVIDHGNGYLTHYAHLNQTAVKVGQQVTPGQTIGYEGSTGDSTGPHLHFEVHNGLWNQVDPAPWMRARGVDLGC